MELLYILVTPYEPGRARREIAPEIGAQVALAREAGFDAIRVGEHHATDDQYLLDEAVLAHVSALAGDMDGMTGLCLRPYHDPVRIAEYGARLDVLTDGGFRLGVGQGYRPEEFPVFGVDPADAPGPRRGPRGDRAALDRGPRDLPRGAHRPRRRHDRPRAAPGATAADCRRRGQRAERPPGGPYRRRLVGLSRSVRRPPGIRRSLPGRARPRRGRSGNARDHPRGLRRGDGRSDGGGGRGAPAREVPERHRPGTGRRFEADTLERAWEEPAADRFVVGSPETVVEELSRYRDGLGLDFVSPRMQSHGMTFEDARATVELFADEAALHL